MSTEKKLKFKTKVAKLTLGNRILTEDGPKRLLEIKSCRSGVYDTILVLEEPRESWMPAIGRIFTSQCPCNEDDEVEIDD